MGITKDGIEAERKAREWLINKGIKEYQQLDWIFKNSKGEYWIIESKARELFTPPPFWGTGLDISQLNLRKGIYTDLGIDTILLVFEKGKNNIFWQALSILEQGEHYDTKNNIRIYPIKNFYKEQY